MSATTVRARSDSSTDSYMDLVRQLPLRPIRNRRQYAAAEAMLDRLALLNDKLDDGQADYLETLELLVDAYDDKHAQLALKSRSPLELLKYLMEQNRMGPAAIGDLIGSRPVATMILKGERELSKAHIRSLAERFKVDPGLFL